MKKPSILHISAMDLWTGDTNQGMSSLYQCLKGYVEADFDVTFLGIFPKNHPIKVEHEVTEGIKIYRYFLPFPIVSQKYYWMHRLTVKLQWLTWRLRGKTIVRTFMGQNIPDIIYAHTCFAARTGYSISRGMFIPNVTRLYGTFLFPFLKKRWALLKHFEEVEAFTTPADVFICTNDGTMGDKVAKHYGIDRFKTFLFLQNGFDRKELSYDASSELETQLRKQEILPGDKVILTLSRLQNWKRLDLAIHSFSEYVRSSQDQKTKLLIVGDGPEKQTLVSLANQLGLQNQICFLGMIERKYIGTLMRRADIFLSLYDLSNLSNPLLEAMSVGTAVLVRNNGGVDSLITNGQNGILVSANPTPMNVSSGLLDLLSNEPKRRNLAENARTYASRHFLSWSERMQKEIETVENVCLRNSKSAS